MVLNSGGLICRGAESQQLPLISVGRMLSTSDNLDCGGTEHVSYIRAKPYARMEKMGSHPFLLLHEGFDVTDPRAIYKCQSQ